MWQFEGTIAAITEVTERIKVFDVRIPDDISFDFEAGQFLSLAVPVEGRKHPHKRAYSIASTPAEAREGQLNFCITKVEGGRASTWLHDRQVGDRMDLKGPYGKFVLKEIPKAGLVFVSTGTGIAPFRSMILDLFDQGCEVPITLFHGMRYEDGLLYDDEFQALRAKHQNFKYVPCVSRVRDAENWSGQVGYVQHHIPSQVGRWQGQQVYICGLKAMIEEVSGVLSQQEFPTEAIHTEKYD